MRHVKGEVGLEAGGGGIMDVEGAQGEARGGGAFAAPALEPLLGPGSRCRVVVGGRSDHLHGSFGHWTRVVRRSSTGLLLNPRLDTDGDLLGVRLPRRVPVPLQAGRGFLVTDADAVIVQVAS